MKNRDAFSAFHPTVSFVYFGLVIVLSAILNSPLCIFISLFFATAYIIRLSGAKAARKLLFFGLPLMFFTALINPAFNHEGVTILTYLPTGNPLTLESILYGIAAAGMIFAAVLWFFCFSETVTSDKFVYLFGRIIPVLSLVLSMTLRFVPRFIAHFKEVFASQKALRGKSGFKLALTVFSATVTWALESSVISADSMKSRGYGLPHRSAFAIYIFTSRDIYALIFLLFCGFFCICGKICGGFYFRWFPSINPGEIAVFPVLLRLFYALLCAFPLITDITEDIKWNSLYSKI